MKPAHRFIRLLPLVAAGAMLVILPVASVGISSAHAAEVIKTGKFRGVSGHKSSGSMKIVRDGGRLKVVFGKDFRLRDAPDATLSWGRNGFKRGTFFGKLRKLRGAQEYTIPKGTDLSKYNQFWLWCEKYNVGLAVAKLK